MTLIKSFLQKVRHKTLEMEITYVMVFKLAALILIAHFLITPYKVHPTANSTAAHLFNQPTEE